MCYGQTGSGKTFTLACEAPSNKGVMLRAFDDIFDQKTNNTEGLMYEVEMGYVQVYMEAITCLFAPGSDVELREDPKIGVFLAGNKWCGCESLEDAIKCLQWGNSNRTTAHTMMNAQSSRSHACLMLKILCTGGIKRLAGMMYMVDLAGSERIKKSGVIGLGFEEACAINQSLTTLGRCIECLAAKKKGMKPPYRDSKLTRLLQSAFGGGSKTSLIICCAPSKSDSAETLNSLQFGQQAMNVAVRAKVNAVVDFSSLCSHMQVQLDDKMTPFHVAEMKLYNSMLPKIALVRELGKQCSALEQAVRESEAEVNSCTRATDVLKSQEKQDRKKHQLAVAKAEHEINALKQKLHEAQLELINDPELKTQTEAQEAEKRALGDKLESMKTECTLMETAKDQGEQAIVAIKSTIPDLAKGLGDDAVRLAQEGKATDAGIAFDIAVQTYEEEVGAGDLNFISWKANMSQRLQEAGGGTV